MHRPILGALAAAAIFALPVAGAQARMADPGLKTAGPALVQDVHYRSYRHHHRWSHHPRRHWTCWTVRKRVHVGHHRTVVRKVRRCGWRYR